mmetsp:Transcript_22824/g.52213  ORF Transcript_22824/g.52213 Transcript_22824/m.52213 type:complete len:209 (+) Transcript_22824:59-685(+)
MREFTSSVSSSGPGVAITSGVALTSSSSVLAASIPPPWNGVGGGAIGVGGGGKNSLALSDANSAWAASVVLTGDCGAYLPSSISTTPSMYLMTCSVWSARSTTFAIASKAPALRFSWRSLGARLSESKATNSSVLRSPDNTLSRSDALPGSDKLVRNILACCRYSAVTPLWRLNSAASTSAAVEDAGILPGEGATMGAGEAARPPRGC